LHHAPIHRILVTMHHDHTSRRSAGVARAATAVQAERGAGVVLLGGLLLALLLLLL